MGVLLNLLPKITTDDTQTAMAIMAPVDTWMDPAEGPAAPASESIADGSSRSCNGAMSKVDGPGVLATDSREGMESGVVAREKIQYKFDEDRAKVNDLIERRGSERNTKLMAVLDIPVILYVEQQSSDKRERLHRGP